MAMSVNESDQRLFSALRNHDPEALQIMSRDGQTLTRNPESWRALYKKYTTWEIPKEVQDPKQFFMDRVVYSPLDIYAKFRAFMRSYLSGLAGQIREGQDHLWRFRWICTFPFNANFFLTFIAQNMNGMVLAPVTSNNIEIYLEKDPGIDIDLFHWALAQEDYIKIVQVRVGLPTNFAGCQHSSESSAFQTRLLEVFDQEMGTFKRDVHRQARLIQLAPAQPVES